MAKQTQTTIARALMQLMLEKPLDSITVNDLIERANVNRKTFYYNFHGIADLLNWIYTVWIEAVVPLEEVSPDTWQRLFKGLMEAIKEQSKYLNDVYQSRYAPSFRLNQRRAFDREMARFVRSAVEIYEKTHNVNVKLSKTQLRYVERYYSMAFFGMLDAWFTGGMKEDEDEFVSMLTALSRDTMYDTFEFFITSEKE